MHVVKRPAEGLWCVKRKPENQVDIKIKIITRQEFLDFMKQPWVKAAVYLFKHGFIGGLDAHADLRLRSSEEPGQLIIEFVK